MLGEPGRQGWVFNVGSWPLRSASPSGVSLSPCGTVPVGDTRGLGAGGTQAGLAPLPMLHCWERRAGRLGKWFLACRVPKFAVSPRQRRVGGGGGQKGGDGTCLEGLAGLGWW